MAIKFQQKFFLAQCCYFLKLELKIHALNKVCPSVIIGWMNDSIGPHAKLARLFVCKQTPMHSCSRFQTSFQGGQKRVVHLLLACDLHG